MTLSVQRFLRVRVALALPCMLAIVLALRGPAFAGPPFATDDPVPTDFRNWEIYTGVDDANGRDGTSARLPFAEFNYGLMPNVQVSAAFPLSYERSAPGSSYRYGPTEFGIKTRFAAESANAPQIAFYPSVEIPNGGGPARTFLPLWLQKSSGKWTVFGGAGVYVNSGAGRWNGTFTGVAVTRDVSAAAALGVEVFHSSPEGPASPASTGFNAGLISAIGEDHAVLFSVGRSVDDGNSLTAYAAYEFKFGPVHARR